MQVTCFLFAIVMAGCSAMYPTQCGSYPNLVTCPTGFTCWRQYGYGGGIGGGIGGGGIGGGGIGGGGIGGIGGGGIGGIGGGGIGGIGGMYGTSECVASMRWQCPMIMQGQNTWGFKRCMGGGIGGGIGGMQQCNTYQGERCCNGFCVKGPALISSGMGMSNGGVYSGAEKSGAEGGKSNKKPVAPKKP